MGQLLTQVPMDCHSNKTEHQYPLQSTQKQQHLVLGPAGPNTSEAGDGPPPRLETSHENQHQPVLVRDLVDGMAKSVLLLLTTGSRGPGSGNFVCLMSQKTQNELEESLQKFNRIPAV